MCAVSAVTDYYRDKWSLIPFYGDTIRPYDPFVQPQINPGQFTLKPGVVITEEQWAEYQELKRRMEEYDARTGQPDCIKPEVAAWEQVVRNNLVTA